MKKILFTDLDGTLLNNESLISPIMKEALQRMIHSGNTLVLSSGRPLDSIKQVKKHAGIDFPGIYIIANNGCLIYDCDNEKNLLEIRVPMEQVMLAWSLAKKHSVHIQTYSDFEIITETDDPEIRVYRSKIHLPLLLAKDPSAVLKKNPYKLLAIDLNNKKHLCDYADALTEQSKKSLTTIFSNDRYLEVFSKDGGKGNALSFLCNYLSIPIQNSYASGDAQNDLSMLQAAGTSVAMKNADPVLFSHADIITAKTNDENGLLEVIESCLYD